MWKSSLPCLQYAQSGETVPLTGEKMRLNDWLHAVNNFQDPLLPPEKQTIRETERAAKLTITFLPDATAVRLSIAVPFKISSPPVDITPRHRRKRTFTTVMNDFSVAADKARPPQVTTAKSRISGGWATLHGAPPQGVGGPNI
uniref:Uncharacterized protein n=1 Tax=Trypanosoma congolense (strain IL3000) TaxID=1068625 RepID=G0UPW8_TRYCI|nr:hypothetical protein, unlikely [Trypanosoma congolense IL3000]